MGWFLLGVFVGLGIGWWRGLKHEFVFLDTEREP